MGWVFLFCYLLVNTGLIINEKVELAALKRDFESNEVYSTYSQQEIEEAKEYIKSKDSEGLKDDLITFLFGVFFWLFGLFEE